MSVEAISWALAQPVQHSSTKFVLVALANCSDGRSFECYPSIAYLCDATAQNRKTVMENIKRLIDLGCIEDTGERKGKTGQIKAYRLNVKTAPKTVLLEGVMVASVQASNDTENGTVKESRKRNSTENGTVPKTDGKSTENGQERVPKTGHGTVSEPSVNQKQVHGRASAPDTVAPIANRKPQITFDAFVERRKVAGEKLIPADDPIFDWAEGAGIPDDWLRLAWSEFSARYRGNSKRYADWPATFRNCIRGNWFKLWRISDGGQYALTTEGEMARRAAATRARKPEQEEAA
ncbi:helix-turn-helix domain-containing protein [Aromatoleum anaerobium]|uniref:Helix-turn-helix domain-containing protein n=1 Tax=Aromatoleum anaerobium TaxID=182180 RepID=A0ABX1PU56_9RHOO|nr:helix-turn-helix domain-containing protein [Aromatoleum anaerobium]MCK0507941.1 helix-turn-helix domain-containing protein [Aromatoleum anaerobium]